MQKAKRFLIMTALILVLSGTTITAAMNQGRYQNTFQESEAVALRSETVNKSVTRNDVLDCETYIPDSKPILPPEQPFFRITGNVEITPDNGRDYTAAVWSPKSDAIVFVSPTEDYRPIPQNEALPSTDNSQPIAVSKNELLLYSLPNNSWTQITADGASPTWSADGQSMYYMSGTNLLRYDPATQSTSQTGEQAPENGVSLLLGRPLSSGKLLTPNEQSEAGTGAVRQIGVTLNDRISPSPKSEYTVVAYGSTSTGGQFTPAVAVLHRSDGSQIPLMKNCQYSAQQIAWSQAGNRIVYPVHAERPEIRVYDAQLNQTSIPLRLASFDRLSNPAWSPNEAYLAFSQGDGRSEPRALWVVSTDGAFRQHLTDGLLPNWSPNGKHILYARPGTGRLLDWHLLEVEPQ
jgi:Tol biopolymer transport system component